MSSGLRLANHIRFLQLDRARSGAIEQDVPVILKPVDAIAWADLVQLELEGTPMTGGSTTGATSLEVAKSTRRNSSLMCRPSRTPRAAI